MPSLAETPAPPSSADFPDWLSPMLVKELRQGVRTRVFVSLFILLQVTMLLTVSLTLLVAAHGEDASAGTVFFWIFVGLPVLVVLPLNGLGAVNGEIKANTLELIFLTRLTAFRIVAGKWLAIFVQCLLFVCAVLPYLVLRYFIGGVNLAVELELLGWMLLGSAVISAFATGLSAYPVRTVRATTSLFFVLGTFVLGPTLELLGRGVVAGTGPGLAQVAGLIVCAGIILLLMLEVGAARIAPPAENHSAVMRLLAAGGWLTALAVSFLNARSVAILFLTFVISGLVCLVGLCEEPRWIPSLFRPFAVRGWAGRAVGRLFYPGWYTAVPYTLLTFAAFGWLFWRAKVLDSSEHGIWFVAVLGSLLLPVALIRLFSPRTKRAAVLFVVVQLLSVLTAVLALVCDSALGTALKVPASFVPLAALIVSLGDPEKAQTRFSAAAITTAVSVGLLAIAVLRAWGQARRAENESLPRAAAPPAVSHDATLA